jgi:hypothetical protein
MADDRADNLNNRASEIRRDLREAAEQHSQPSHEQLERVVEALQRDVRTASDNAVIAEERLVKIESQTRVLTEAVMAITHTADAVGPTGQAATDE